MKKQSRTMEKTRAKLLNSFWKLYKEKDISKVSIGELCNDADYECRGKHTFELVMLRVGLDYIASFAALDERYQGKHESQYGDYCTFIGHKRPDKAANGMRGYFT